MAATIKKSHTANAIYQGVDTLARKAVGEDKGLLPTHQDRVVAHNFQIGVYIGCKVGLVNHQNVGVRYARAILAGNLIAGRNINDIYEEIDQRRTKGESEVVASRLDKYHIGIGEATLHLLYGGNVHRGVLAYGSMGAGTCLHAYDTLLDEYALEHASHMLGILGGYYIVGYDEYLVPHLQQTGCYGLYDGGLARAYGAAYSYSATVFHCLNS